MAEPLKPQYDPAGVSLLSSKAPTGLALEEQAIVAEVVLGLAGLDLGSDTDARQVAAIAVAHQVNFWIEEGVNPRKFARHERGERSYQTTEAAQLGIDPVAARLAQHLIDKYGADGAGQSGGALDSSALASIYCN